MCGNPFYLCAVLTLDLQMPPHILTVYQQQSDPSKKSSQKKVREDSAEFKIFKFLNILSS